MVDPVDEGGEAPCFAHLLDETPLQAPTDLELAHLVRALADAVVIADHDGRITFWNSAAQRLFGWTPNEAIGETLDLIVPERQRRRHWDGYATTMATGRTSYADRLLEVPALHRDGHTISIAFTVTLLAATDAPAGHRSIAAVIRDDTERRQLTTRLRNLDAEPNDGP